MAAAVAPVTGHPVAVVEPLGDEQYEIVWEVESEEHPISTGPLQDSRTLDEAEQARDAIQRILNRDGTLDPARFDDVLRAAGVK